MTQSRSLKVPRWRRWAGDIGEVNSVDAPAMVRAARAANKEHAQQALDTIIHLLEAEEANSVQIDGSAPPGFVEWRLKGIKTTWFAEMAPTDRHDSAVWPAPWKTNVPSITHEFMYKVLWKKLQVRQRVGLVKDIQDGRVWCGAQETVYCFVKSCPMVRILYAACRDVAAPVVQGMDVGRWVADDPIIALTNPTGLCVWWGLHRLWTLQCQAAVRHMEVGTVSVVMALGVTFTRARAWFGNMQQMEAAQTSERLSTWF